MRLTQSRTASSACVCSLSSPPARNRFRLRVGLLSGAEQVGEAGMAVDAELDREAGIVSLRPGVEASVGIMLLRDDCPSVRLVVQDPATDAVLGESGDDSCEAQHMSVADEQVPVRDQLDDKVTRIFAGKVVRKDLVRKVKVGANVPVFVLEYLLGKYCASSDELAIRMGLDVVNGTLADNYIRPDESTKAQSLVKEKGTYTFIDKVKVRLVDSRYWADVTNFGHKQVHIPDRYVRDFDRLLTGGIWAQIDMRFEYDEEERGKNPFWIDTLTPIQLATFDLDEYRRLRAEFTVNVRLRVGGPATAQAAWVDRFIRHCVENHIPVDFVSTHVYANDTAADVFGTKEAIPRTQMVCRAARKVHDQVTATPRPDLPIIWSEYNASYKNEPDVTDSVFMGPWLADTIRQCDGLTDVMAYWTFSDVFEEQGVIKQPFYGGFGLIAEDGLPKPSFNAFKLLHLLGQQRIAEDSESALITRRSDGTLVMAVWNLFLPEEQGEPKTVTIVVKGLAGHRRSLISRVDSTHGSLFGAYYAMGKPLSPTQRQIDELRHAAELPSPEIRYLQNGKLTIVLPPQGLALIELR